MDQFDLDTPPPVPNTDDMRPTDQALIIDGTGPRLMRWGLTVTWDKKPLINARAETLAEKPTFRPLLEQRCLVPMTAYLEWRKADDGSKRKNRIAPADGAQSFANARAALHAFDGTLVFEEEEAPRRAQGELF